MKVVECGGNGDCFYHSVLYLLRLHTPDFRLDCARSKKFVPLSVEDSSVTHMDMRKAVCRHLRDSIQGEELKRIVLESKVLEVDSKNWPEPNHVGK
jgi:hypothetical protein